MSGFSVGACGPDVWNDAAPFLFCGSDSGFWSPEEILPKP